MTSKNPFAAYKEGKPAKKGDGKGMKPFEKKGAEKKMPGKAGKKC